MNPLQRASVRRKVIYFAVILGLFTVSMFWRGVIPIPLSNVARANEAPSSLHRTADKLAARTILNQSVGLELRELEEGEQEIEGSTRRLAFIGSRGLVVAYMWQSAIDKQKRNDFHEMDRLIRRVTQLQPHFITPWIFQSWNIAYNVSVEMQGSGDMYYYIARGIELLAEGERRQGRIDRGPDGTERRLGSPDMRYQIAFYYQNKFGVSDNVEVLRCLYQLSCISPDERNPDELEEIDERGEKVVNLKKFREFCEKYPHLVRRLRGEDQNAQGVDEQSRKKIQEALKCPRPQDVIQFLRDNKDVPSRYKFKKELNDADKQFPILPPMFASGQGEAHPGMETKDDFSGYKAARAWFAYSTVPLPDNPKDSNGEPLPWRTPQAGEYDAVKYRVPRQPMLVIFRQGKARAQSYQAEMEQKEGWFDDEGWRVDNPWADRANRWFPDEVVVIGGKEGGFPKWSIEEWRTASRMWAEHGYEYGLEVSAPRLENYRTAALRIPSGAMLPDPTPEQAEDARYMDFYHNANAWFYYQTNRQVTNFPFFLASAKAEEREATAEARKILWKAEQARKRGDKFNTPDGGPGAIALYKEGLERWKQVLAADEKFHRPENATHTEEQTYTHELAYLRLLVQDDPDVREKAAVASRQAAVPFQLFPIAAPGIQKVMEQRDVQEEFKWHVAENVMSPLAKLISRESDGVTDKREGTPWVRDSVKESVRTFQGVQRKVAADQNAPVDVTVEPMP